MHDHICQLHDQCLQQFDVIACRARTCSLKALGSFLSLIGLQESPASRKSGMRWHANIPKQAANMQGLLLQQHRAKRSETCKPARSLALSTLRHALMLRL